MSERFERKIAAAMRGCGGRVVRISVHGMYECWPASGFPRQQEWPGNVNQA